MTSEHVELIDELVEFAEEGPFTREFYSREEEALILLRS